MLTLPPTVRVFLAIEPADMRRSLDGLAELTREVLKRDPLSGHLFVFRNRRSDRIKVLVWDRSGLCLWYKRLERGRFFFPVVESAEVEVEAAELALLLEGIDLAGAKRRPRFTPQRASASRNS